MKKSWLVLLIIGLIIIAWFYFSSKKVIAPIQPINVTSTQSGMAVPAVSKITSITVTAKEYSFTPTMFFVPSGAKVSLTFKNEGQYPHNWTVNSNGFSAATKTINPGETTNLAFTAPASGNYDFYCSVDGHKDLGMKGVLIVQ